MNHYASCRFHSTQKEADCGCETKRYIRIFFLGIFILLIEIVGGIFSGSLALLADAGHVLADNVATIVSILVAILVKKHSAKEKRIRAFGGHINALLLLVLAFWVGFEAVTRFYNPREILSEILIAVAFLGGALNWWQHEVLETHGKHDHVTHKAMSFHIKSDLWQSVGVVASGFVIYFTDWKFVDPLFSLYIAYRMAKWGIELFEMSGDHRHHHGHHHH